MRLRQINRTDVLIASVLDCFCARDLRELRSCRDYIFCICLTPRTLVAKGSIPPFTHDWKLTNENAGLENKKIPKSKFSMSFLTLFLDINWDPGCILVHKLLVKGPRLGTEVSVDYGFVVLVFTLSPVTVNNLRTSLQPCVYFNCTL